MKECTRCKETKADSEFARKNKEGTKLSSECKLCHNVIRKAYYETNKQIEIARTAVTKEKYRQWFIELKSSLSCEVCNETHPATLQFHHPNPEVKDFSVSQAISHGYSKKSILQEIEKCKVLCANCHFKLHWDEDKRT